MRILPIEAGNFKLDGGAMFGVVPKSLWQRTNPADANNMIDMAARCLLIESGDRLVLIDTGMGDKQSEKFFGYYYLWGEHSLEKSLKNAGYSPDDITDVFLTHLHFDHSGGAINKAGDRLVPRFKNAHYWSNKNHWQWATNPNPREKASFLSENILPIEESGQLKFVSTDKGFQSGDLSFEVFFADGHTDKQMIPYLNHNDKTFVFAADLLPTAGHIPLPYVMGYDTRPLLTLDEKAVFLNRAADEGHYIILEHDPYHEIITLKHTEKGVRLDKIFTFAELFD
ncbi:MAG: MBL fold metallo-hydrolase [Flavobacteriaceae bacterium]|nr:MBL fold metallo-hydrolase [Flavobacteriaceae bacterium]